MELRRTWTDHDTSPVSAGFEMLRRADRSSTLAAGTLACNRCDAPVAIGEQVLTPAHELSCPYCRHHGPLRDFLSLEPPTRPARVVVRVRRPAAR